MLLDAPHGDVFGHLDNELAAWNQVVALNAETQGRLAVAVGATQEAHQLVAFDTSDGVHIRAFVATSDIHPIPHHHRYGMGLHGTGIGCGCAMNPRPNVLAGSPVYDAADGEMVGWVTNDRRFDLDVVDTPPPEHHGLLSTLLSLQDAPSVNGLPTVDDMPELFVFEPE